MSTSPLDPDDIRAAAEVHRELGTEYGDAVVAAFIDRVDRAVAARVEVRLAGAGASRAAVRAGRRTLLKGIAIGVCAGALVAGVGVSYLPQGSHHDARVFLPGGGLRHGQGGFGHGEGGLGPPPAPPPPPPPPPPAVS